MRRKRILTAFLLGLAALAASLSAALSASPGDDQARPDAWAPLVERLAGDGLPRQELDAWFCDPSVNFDPSIMAHKVDRMVRKQFEPAPPPSMRTLQQSAYGGYLKPWMLAWAAEYARDNQEVLAQAEAAYGVPQDVIMALLLVETKLGSFLGKDKAFQVLASMAASNSIGPIRPYLKSVGANQERADFADASARDRGEWAYKELKALIAHARSSSADLLGIPGSIYGAIGICQFMPTNALRFGVDGDRDGRVDLFNPRDAIPSIANYLVGHGWKKGMTYEQQRAVIYAYNHSDLYSLAVMTIAEKLRKTRTGS